MKHDIAPGYYPNPSNNFVYSGGSLASHFLKRRNGSYHPQLQSLPPPQSVGRQDTSTCLPYLPGQKIKVSTGQNWKLRVGVDEYWWSFTTGLPVISVIIFFCEFALIIRMLTPFHGLSDFGSFATCRKMQRFVHKAWTKHWSQYLGKWPGGMKTHQTELYDMYQAQGCPKVIHRKTNAKMSSMKILALTLK